MNTEETNGQVTLPEIIDRLTQFCNKLESVENQINAIALSLAHINSTMTEVNLSLDSVLFKMEESNQAFNS